MLNSPSSSLDIVGPVVLAAEDSRYQALLRFGSGLRGSSIFAKGGIAGYGLRIPSRVACIECLLTLSPPFAILGIEVLGAHTLARIERGHSAGRDQQRAWSASTGAAGFDHVDRYARLSLERLDAVRCSKSTRRLGRVEVSYGRIFDFD